METLGGAAVFYSYDSLRANEEPIYFESDRLSYNSISPYDAIMLEIDSFVVLENNWDGYGAIPTLSPIAEKVKKFFVLMNSDLIDKLHDIFPNPHGTITLEWMNSQEEKLSLEIGEHNYSYFVKSNNHPPKLVDGEDILDDCKIIAKEVSDLFSDEFSNTVF